MHLTILSETRQQNGRAGVDKRRLVLNLPTNTVSRPSLPQRPTARNGGPEVHFEEQRTAAKVRRGHRAVAEPGAAGLRIHTGTAALTSGVAPPLPGRALHRLAGQSTDFAGIGDVRGCGV